MPYEYVTFGETWQRHHPEWRLRTWDESNLPQLVNQALFDESSTYAQKADIARYELLVRFGGVYLDCDFECFRNIEPLLGGVEAFAATEDGHWISIGILGCVPGHPLFQAMVDRLPALVANCPGRPPNEQTGPRPFTGIIREHLASGYPGTVVFGRDLFYPYHYGEPHRRYESFPRAYAVHHWAQTWCAPESQPQEFGRARLVVILGPEQHDPALAVIEEYFRMFQAGDPVEMVICSSGLSQDADHAVRRLLDSVNRPGRTVPEVRFRTRGRDRRRSLAWCGSPMGGP